MSNKFKFWKGDKITEMTGDNIFVFGSNPSGIHGAGAAKMAVKFGAEYGNGRGLMGNSYALVTKNLTPGYYEKSTGITYAKDGYCSVSPEQIAANIDELYECAKTHPQKKFFVTFQNETWPNGQPRKSLNGYTGQQMCQFFTDNKNIPDNIRFHDSFKNLLNFKNDNNPPKNTEKENFTFFWLTYSEFSQWHPSLFKYNDVQFISAEQFMMYSKAKLFNDGEIAQNILDFNSTHIGKKFIDGEVASKDILKDKVLVKEWNEMMKGMKNLGRKVNNYNEELWVKKRIPIVSVGSREKYSQNPHLKEKLMDTATTTLVEASPYDKIWGIGLKASDPRANVPFQWQGLNLLGDILTKLRNGYKIENKPRNKFKP